MARINRSSMYPSAAGIRRTSSIINNFSSAGYGGQTILGDSGAIATLSGALTANTLKTMLNITSIGGVMTILAVKTNDNTARTLRVVVTVDGASAYDFTSASMSSGSLGCQLAGKQRSETSNYYAITPNIVWTTSLKIEIASNLTETDKFTCYWLYNTET